MISLSVAWLQNEIPKCGTTGGPVIVFKDTITVSIYWGNRWPQANRGYDHSKKKKEISDLASFLLQRSASLMLGSSLVLALRLWFVWMMMATYGLPLRPQNLSEIAQAALLNWPSRDELLWFVSGSLSAKTNHFSGSELSPGLILFTLCQEGTMACLRSDPGVPARTCLPKFACACAFADVQQRRQRRRLL